MYNLRNNRPKSVIQKMKFDLVSQHNHRRVVIVGSGETGFLALNKTMRLPFLKPEDVGLVSNEPVHRTRFGSLLYSMKYYEKIDFENPLLGSHVDSNFTFDEILHIDPKASRLWLHNQQFIDFDYLILACGRETDQQKCGHLIQHSEETYNDLYNADSFYGYKKLRGRFPSLHEAVRFNILVMRDSDQIENCVNFALLFRKKFKRAEITIVSENSWLIDNAEANSSLIGLLEKNGICLLTQSKVEIQRQDQGVSIRVNQDMEIGNELVFFAPSKQIPSFLANTPELLPETFDAGLLQNSTYPEIFAAGSYFNPSCGLKAKTLQTNCVISNIAAGLSRDRNKKIPELAYYKYEDKMYLFKDFTRIMTLDRVTGELKSSFIDQKKTAWRFLNWDMLAYFYIQKHGFAHKRLFN